MNDSNRFRIFVLNYKSVKAMVNYKLSIEKPFPNRSEYQVLRAAIDDGTPESAKDYLQFEWNCETSVVSSDELGTCLTVLSQSGDKDFQHYIDTRLITDEDKDAQCVQRLKHINLNLAGFLELQYVADYFITFPCDPSQFQPLIDKLSEVTADEPRFYYYLGRLLCSENNLAQDWHAAIKAYKKGIEYGSQRCQYALCYAYLYGDEVIADQELGLIHLSKFANYGNYRAMVKLASLYLCDEDKESEYEALDMLEEAICYANPVTACILYTCYNLDKGDMEGVLMHSWACEECTDANSWYDELCLLYMNFYFEKYGKIPELQGCEHLSLTQAFLNYQAVKSGRHKRKEKEYLETLMELCTIIPSCGYFLGLIYENGYGVPVNPERAFYWMQKAETNCFAPAVIHLAEYYERGFYVEQSLESAIELYEDASDLSFYRHSYVMDKLEKLRYLVDD